VNSKDSFQTAYHRWYYEQEIWNRTTFMGVPCLKAVTDLWNYQEIIATLRPSVVLELGTYLGGSALYLAEMARLANPASRVITVDRKVARIAEAVRQHPAITIIEAHTVDSSVARTVASTRAQSPGPMFAILDSGHAKDHVLAELEMLRGITLAGDYVVVEDTNMNGHPIVTDFGDGPMEAVCAYGEIYPADYVRDIERENKFGLTFAPSGYLIRQ
jgi:cephalosporin hydroxylase